MSNSTKRKTPLTKILFLLAGLCLFVKYILDGGLPSSMNGITEIFTFICKFIILILIVGLYAVFLFGVPGYESSFKALAPSILFLVIGGQYALSYGNADVDAFLLGLADMIWLVMIVTGFVFLFFRKKAIGMTFGICALIYAFFIAISYTVVTIISVVNGASFSLNAFFIMAFLVVALGLCFAGTYIGLRRREWSE